MWIFSKTGFISAVRKTDRPDVVTVRSRDTESLESIAQRAGVPIAQSPFGDYPDRAFVSPEVFSEWLSVVALTLDYDNFKSHIAHTRGYDYALELGRVWSVMLATEDEDARLEILNHRTTHPKQPLQKEVSPCQTPNTPHSCSLLTAADPCRPSRTTWSVGSRTCWRSKRTSQVS